MEHGYQATVIALSGNMYFKPGICQYDYMSDLEVASVITAALKSLNARKR